MKLSQFWNKYKLYVIIGIVLGVILGLVYWLSSKNSPKVEDNTITAIQSPFPTQQETVSFSEYTNNIEIAPKLEIYKASKSDATVAVNFTKRFSTTNPYIVDDLYYWSFSGSTISYTPSTSILYLNSEKGLVTDIKIGAKSDLKSFLLDYFNIRDIEITEITELGNGKYEYKGYYVYETLQYGSLHINGYSIAMIADSSKIFSLSILLLPGENIVEYQQMPTANLTDLLSQNDIYTKYLSYDDNYKKQYPIIQGSAKLKSVEIKSATYKYVFIDHSYTYILPVYEIKGDGLLIDSQKNQYWAGVLVYTSTLDRGYINKVETFQENMILLDQSN